MRVTQYCTFKGWVHYTQFIYKVYTMCEPCEQTCEPRVEPNPKADPHQTAFLEIIIFNTYIVLFL